MRKQTFNPYLPSWEYIPDGEPHVFDGRVYVYGSHDRAHGRVFCLGDYVCYSASVDNLKDWRYEGVIYRRLQDPANKDGKMVLYAPDVTRGSDGRYYLYYVLDKVGFVSVAVSDTPSGKYEFYGYVHYKDGTRLGDRKGDMPQFDPGVLTEGKKTYMYTAFCGNKMHDRIGAMATVLGEDMLTVEEEPRVIVPGDCYALDEEQAKAAAEAAENEQGCPYELCDIENWKGFAGHAFFEASSIRKIEDTYCFVYSSQVMHELCYATSRFPTHGFTYRGVIVSNCDMHIGTYKDADMPSACGANNHGGIERIGGDYYIFYHRHTNGTWYSRQGCAEKIKVAEGCAIAQVQMTSCGLNAGPLEAQGEYPAYIACNLFTSKPSVYVDASLPHITQEWIDNEDGSPLKEEDSSYIAGVRDGTTIGFKYFSFRGIKKIGVTTRAYIKGFFEVKTELNGPVIARIPVDYTDFWEESIADAPIPDGDGALYLKFTGDGSGDFKSFRFIS